MATANNAIPTNKNSNISWMTMIGVFVGHNEYIVFAATYLTHNTKKMVNEAIKPKLPI